MTRLRPAAAVALLFLALLAAPKDLHATWLQIVGPLERFDPEPMQRAAEKLRATDDADLLNHGMAAARAGEWEQGVLFLGPLPGHMFIAEDVVRIPLARCLLNLNRTDEALAHLEAALTVAHGPWASEAHVLAARAYADKKHWDRAEAHLALVTEEDGRIADEARLVRAVILSGRGKRADAREILAYVAEYDPIFREFYYAPEGQGLFDRAAAGKPVVLDSEGLARRAATLLKAQEYDLALQTCMELHRRDPAYADKTSFLWTWAKVYFRLNDPAGRTEKYTELHRRYRGSDSASGLYRAGIAAWRRGGDKDDDLALKYYRQAFEAQPKKRDARNALMRGGRLMLARGRYQEAEQLFLKVAENFPRSRKDAHEAVKLAGVCQLMDGRAKEAAQTLEALIEKGGSETPGALYWAAQARKKLGNERTAASHVNTLRRRYPRSYYAAITELNPADESWVYDAGMANRLIAARADRAESARTAAAALVQEVSGIGDPKLRMITSAKLVRPLTRALLFIEAGAHSLARPDLQELMALRPYTLRSRMAVLVLYELAGESRWSLKLAYHFSGDSKAASDALTAEFGLSPKQLIYPPTWSEFVVPACKGENLDPVLAMSVIRQESAYDADAISIANARGLMQFIPPMVASTAASLGMQDVRPDKVYEPAFNVRLGARHLQDLLGEHEGNIVLALAAYNATEPVARKWSDRGMKDMPLDVAAEAIMFQETRTYVKTILSNVSLYRRIYTTGGWKF